MKGIMILAHGSRVKSTVDTIETVVSMVKDMVDLSETPVEIAYMELCEPNIAKTVDKLVKMGVDEIKVVPYFLFEGIHIKEDIPNEISELLVEYPDIKVTMGKTLGADRRLAEILKDRIFE